MFTYESGIFIAFLLWLYGVIRIILLANSKTQKNLKIIGKRMSYNLGVIEDYDYKKEPSTWNVVKFLLFHVFLPLPFILLSWINVVYVVGSYIYVFLKDTGAPQSVKEFRWKLRNVDMSLDQIIKESMKISDQSPDDFEKIKKEILENIQSRKVSAR